MLAFRVAGHVGAQGVLAVDYSVERLSLPMDASSWGASIEGSPGRRASSLVAPASQTYTGGT